MSMDEQMNGGGFLFGGAEGQDFLSDTVKAQISDGSIGRCAAHSLEFIYAHFYK